MKYRTKVLGSTPGCCARPSGCSPRGRPGTMKYVALILLVAGVLATIITARGELRRQGQIGQTIVTKLKEAINDSVGGTSGGGLIGGGLRRCAGGE